MIRLVFIVGVLLWFVIVAMAILRKDFCGWKLSEVMDRGESSRDLWIFWSFVFCLVWPIWMAPVLVSHALTSLKKAEQENE